MIISKYEPIGRKLNLMRQDGQTHVTLSLSEIEEWIGQTLPKSARNHEVWWANNYNEKSRQCQNWLLQGWETERVDLTNEKISFKYIKK